MLNRVLFAGGGAVLGALLVIVAMQTPWDSYKLPSSDAPEEISDTSDSEEQRVMVSKVGPEAFGSLSSANQAMGLGGGGEGDAGVAPMESGGDEMISARPQSGGGGGMATDAMMIAPEPYLQSRYKFGGEITLPEGPVPVYSRVSPSGSPAATDALKGFAGSFIDWSAFGSLNLQNVSLTESGKNPFSINIDYTAGTFSLYKNIDPSTRPDYLCKDSDCYDRNRLRESDMISDEEATRIASDFVSSLGVDLSNYGIPQVTDDWRFWLARSTDKLSYYFPEQITVTFPLLIEGKPVYEEYGYIYGLSVSVDIRSKSANSLYNLSTSEFQQSDYDAVTDLERVKQAVYTGGINTWIDPNSGIVEADLGEPEIAFMHYYLWNDKTYQSKELFIQALVFPVITQPENMTDQRKFVVIPLAEELFNQPQGGINPRPMPLMEEGDVGDDAPVKDVEVEEAAAG